MVLSRRHHQLLRLLHFTTIIFFLLPYLISAIFNRIIRHYLLLCLVSLNFVRFIENVNRFHGVFGTVISEAQDCNDWSYGWHCNRMSKPSGDFEWNQNILKRTEPPCVINNTTILICAPEWTFSSMHSVFALNGEIYLVSHPSRFKPGESNSFTFCEWD